MTILFRQLQKKRDSHIKRDPGLREIFIDPSTGDVWKEGDSYTSPALGRTLARLVAGGGDEFYRGETAKLLVEDITAAGGIITRKGYKKISDWSKNSILSRIL